VQPTWKRPSAIKAHSAMELAGPTPDRVLPPEPAVARAVAASMLSEMCRNIRPLFNFQPPATDDEIRAAALQYVRKVSGTQKPSGKNIAAFERAVEEIAVVTRRLVDSLETTAEPKNREVEADKARARSAIRFG
jgi:hypothetical protein